MKLRILDEALSVVHYNPDYPIPVWATGGPFFSITRTQDELSIFCCTRTIPEGIQAVHGWRAFMVVGPIDLELSGIISLLAMPLAAKQIPIFSISTYETDYMILRDHHLDEAVDVLLRAGHSFES
ncbi:MAG: ACT domain-containing protein [Verrucomicrobia bacterium]|nr:ACT domain-containing protein [Verrucomicrobiota bacterium]